MNGTKRVRTLVVRGVLALTLMMALAAPATGAAAGAGAYYESCGTLNFKGSHKLEHHIVGCAKASRKARYVLKNHSAPRGWKCSLSNLSSGCAACTRGQKAFALFPA